MTHLEKEFENAVAAHQAGDLIRAKNLYEKIITQDSTHADAMHLLGVLAAQLGQFEVAISWIQQAISIKSDVPAFHNNLGNALKALGKLDQAIDHYQIALKLKPDYAEAHNNLAGVLYKQDKLQDALPHYAEAIRLQPDYLEAHVNLGLLFLKENKFTAAITQFNNVINLQSDFMPAHWQLGNLYLAQNELEKAIYHYENVLQENPEHVEALNNLGVVYIKQNNIKKAIEYFQQALVTDPKHQDARSNLAAALLQQDRFTEASWHYQLYLQLAPEDSEAHYNYAVAAMGLGNLDLAIKHFNRTLEINPQHADAHNNLAAIYLKMGRKEQAIDHYQKTKALKPNDSVATYMLSALTSKDLPESAPPEYIKQLFDNYAGTFDKQLIETLHYQIPNLMREALTKFLPQAQEKGLILDLGCGTGLSGVAFHDLAKQLIGVDLSPRMLEKAKDKAIYDELIPANIIDFLLTTPNKFDLIIAADTLVYLGDLSAIIKNCYRILQDQGFFIFSTEFNSGENYDLQPSGRYRHAPAYIEKLAVDSGFKVLESQQIIGRYEQEKPLTSTIYILQKAA